MAKRNNLDKAKSLGCRVFSISFYDNLIEIV